MVLLSNNIVKNNGYVIGKLEKVVASSGTVKSGTKRHTESTTYDRLEFHFKTKGSRGAWIDLNFHTPISLNDEPLKDAVINSSYKLKALKEASSKEKLKYNLLTTLCLKLGLLQEEELKKLSDEKAKEIEEKLEGIKDLPVQFKMIDTKDDKKNPVSFVNILTLEVLENELQSPHQDS